MFVQSLSNIWSIHHTPQVRLLSSNLSYAVWSQLHDSNEQRRTNIVQRRKPVFGNEMGKGAYCHCTPSAERPFVHFKSTFTPQCSLSPRKWAFFRAMCIRFGHSVKWMTSDSSRSLWRSIQSRGHCEMQKCRLECLKSELERRNSRMMPCPSLDSHCYIGLDLFPLWNVFSLGC